MIVILCSTYLLHDLGDDVGVVLLALLILAALGPSQAQAPSYNMSAHAPDTLTLHCLNLFSSQPHCCSLDYIVRWVSASLLPCFDLVTDNSVV